MSENDIEMHIKLLELLEKRHKEGEIDDNSFNELKKRYEKKLKDAKANSEELMITSQIKVAGSQTLTPDSLSVSGSAKISGGKIMRDIRIAGSGKIEGDIECKSIKCSGAAKSTGSITAHGVVKTSGSFKCEDFLHTYEDAIFSGAAKVVGEVIVQGYLKTSGSFKCEDNVQAINGATLSGAATIEGNLVSQKTIDITGKATISGDVVGENIYFKSKRFVFEIKLFRRRELSTVEGNIFAQNEVDIEDIYIEGDVKGKVVKLGLNTNIHGTVYYVEDLIMTDNVKLENEPVKITEEALKL